MDIGIAFDLKPAATPPGAPDDLYEEFDSPATIRAIADALRSLGHTARELGNGPELVWALLDSPPELLFNFAEGQGVGRSREARVPALCEMLNVEYTGSDPLAMAACLDKDIARRLARDAGVAVPRGMVLGPPHDEYDGDCAEFPPLLSEAGFELPVIVKPAFEGSSKGIRGTALVKTAAEFGPAIVALWRDYAQPVLVEEFIAGDEITVGVLGHDPPGVFGVMRITPKTPAADFVYSLEVKRDFKGLVNYECPAKLPRGVASEIEASALAVVDALDLRDVARLDFRLREGVPYFLEANPLPGLNPESSDLVLMANLLGVSHAELIGKVVEGGLARAATAR